MAIEWKVFKLFVQHKLVSNQQEQRRPQSRKSQKVECKHCERCVAHGVLFGQHTRIE